MEWCGYTVVEATGGSICDSCNGEGLVERQATQLDFGEASLEAGVTVPRHRPPGFFARRAFAADDETESCLDAKTFCGRPEQLGLELIEQGYPIEQEFS